MNEQTAYFINELGRFCGKRDVGELTPDELERKFGIRRADVMVLFGGSVLAGGDVTARAIANGAAKKYVIVGGAGHTTDTLREIIAPELAGVDTANLAEAELFDLYLRQKYGLRADFLETKSTNCGNNITYLLDLLNEAEIPRESIILCQDATMQRRMDAGLRKYVPEGTKIINFASYRAEVRFEGGKLSFSEDIRGMWDIDRYVNLLMGEIPRLRDDENGYGPAGKNFIAHVDIPGSVERAYGELTKTYGSTPREANPSFA